MRQERRQRTAGDRAEAAEAQAARHRQRRPEAVALWAAGVPKAEITRRLGVSAGALKVYLNSREGRAAARPARTAANAIARVDPERAARIALIRLRAAQRAAQLAERAASARAAAGAAERAAARARVRAVYEAAGSTLDLVRDDQP